MNIVNCLEFATNSLISHVGDLRMNSFFFVKKWAWFVRKKEYHIDRTLGLQSLVTSKASKVLLRCALLKSFIKFA